MEKVKGIFGEVKGELIKISLIYTFLDSVMVFFIVYFAVSFFNIRLLYTLLIPALITFIFFIISFIKRLNNSKLKDMEDANPQLKDILRTAHDNQRESVSNPMVEALFMELRGKLRTASSGNLLDSKKIGMRIISAILIVFMIVFFSSITINLKKIDIPIDSFKFLKDNNEAHAEGNLTDLVFNQTDVIYGDASVAKLGNDVVNINVNPSMSDVDLDNVGEAENSQLRSSGVQQEVTVSADAYSNQKVLEEAEAAVNYSQRISQIK